MRLPDSIPNPDLTVGADNKQGWNQPSRRRAGFHNAHQLFRRALMVRARRVLVLDHAPSPVLDAKIAATEITSHPAFSALVVAEGSRILHLSHADDFAADRPHSIQSITKLHIHLIFGELIDSGLVDASQDVAHYLPWIGSAYAGAKIRDLLDMNVENNFSEDYADARADCYREEEALGWRLPPDGVAEPTLRDFVAGLTGGDLTNRSGFARYKSANTDVLTLIAGRLMDLRAWIEATADAAGYEGAFHISLSPDGFPAFSGGGCLSARDLARFGLLIARGGVGVGGGYVGSAAFTRASLTRQAPVVSPLRNWQRYSNNLMTDGRWLGHSGYGGQFLMVDLMTGRVAAFLSVLENESGYDEAYMSVVVRALEQILA